MRAARDSLIGLLARTLSGGYKQWTINKQRAALSRAACRRKEKKESFGWQDLSLTLASG